MTHSEQTLRTAAIMAVLSLLDESNSMDNIGRNAGTAWAQDHRLLASGQIDVKPLITETFNFDQSVEAFERAAEHRVTDIKLQILVND